MHRHRTLQDRLSAAINVTPMADVILVLLIIFMITTPLIQSGITVNLPKAAYPRETPGEPDLVIALTREGRLYLSRTPLSGEELKAALADRIAGEIGRPVYVKADQAVAYGQVVEVVNRCRAAGVTRIGLMTEKLRP